MASSLRHRVWLVSLWVGSAPLLLIGCGEGQDSAGDCNARFEYEGTTFRAHNELDQALPADVGELGQADVLGCDDEVVDHVAVHRINGVDPAVAIAITDRDWAGVYAAEGSTPSDWPDQLRTTAASGHVDD